VNAVFANKSAWKGDAMYKKILVPLDGSRTSKQGLDEAITLARHHKARLRLIHVVDVFVVTPTLEGGSYVDDIQETFRASGKKLLARAAALVHKRGLKADTVMLETIGGRAADVIVAQAKKWRADIIVIGTHGRRGLNRLVMGSDAEQVIRSSPVPVLTVRPATAR
jgi:nucleotide-binding universal stress UspA family protein